MGNVVQLWNPRIDPRLGRHWVRFEDPVIVGGDNPGQAGVLTLLPAGDDRLRVRLQVIGNEYEEDVSPGNDIALWIHGLQMLVGVSAVEEGRALVAFGIPRGSRANVTLDDEDPSAFGVPPGGAGAPSGLCQMPG